MRKDLTATPSAGVIDLRSDAVTRPSPGMRAAIAAAPVGDDQFGEDPSVNQLQDRIAALLGKEAGLFVPSGTMANQVALRALARPGEDVIVSRESHIVWHESGAAGANAGVQLTEIGAGGLFTREEFLASIKPRGHALYPGTTLVQIENTHNRAGGIVFPAAEARRVCEAAAAHGIATYLDGARLWNAAAASGRPLTDWSTAFDLVSVALSKGLGAPVGSVLAGTSEMISGCRRHRRMFGGAMRQAGLLAAAGQYALDHHLGRLADDHANARLIGERLATSRRVLLDLATVQTNILVFHLTPDGPDAATVVARAGERGILVFAYGPRRVRAVTHLDVSPEQCARAAEVLLEIVEAGTA